jgi:signal transduction histidine kinase
VAAVVVDVAREGLTNARKHAGTAPVRVAVGTDAGLVRLEVVNEPGVPLLGAGSQRGLAGLRERVEAAGGVLHAGPTDAGGWRLRCTLPREPVRGGG